MRITRTVFQFAAAAQLVALSLVAAPAGAH